MLSSVVVGLRKITRGLLAGDSPGQLAAGFTLGMIIGVMPKGNLIAISLCVLLFSLRVNKGIALLAAALFSAIGMYADSVSHKVGLAVLSIESLQSTYASVYSLPLGPWLGFHNTVATGSIVLGLYLAYPVFWTMRRISAWLSPSAVDHAMLHGSRTSARDERIPRSGVAA